MAYTNISSTYKYVCLCVINILIYMSCTYVSILTPVNTYCWGKWLLNIPYKNHIQISLWGFYTLFLNCIYPENVRMWKFYITLHVTNMPILLLTVTYISEWVINAIFIKHLIIFQSIYIYSVICMKLTKTNFSRLNQFMLVISKT